MADCLGELVREVESMESSVEIAALPGESIKSPDFMDMRLLTSKGEEGKNFTLLAVGYSE